MADAIKELEASTAALQMVYEGGGNGGQPGSRHSVAGYGAIHIGPDGGQGESTDDPGTYLVTVNLSAKAWL